jgi:pimeloyl-ACP methyl ester carboxylesterase
LRQPLLAALRLPSYARALYTDRQQKRIGDKGSDCVRFILIHGLGRDQAYWRPLVALLRQAYPEALIETPDIPGVGILHRTPSPTHLADYLPFLEGQLANSDEQAVLIGLSLGGMLALTWAAIEPQRFRHLVVINTSSRLSPFYRRLKVYRAWRQPAAIFRFSRRAKERAIYHLICNRRPMPDDLLDEWEAIQNRHPVKITNQIRQIWAGLRFLPPDKGLLPALTVIYSKADHWVDPRCSEDLIKYYNSNSYQHGWAGHDLPQDDPQWLLNKLRCLCSGPTSFSDKKN